MPENIDGIINKIKNNNEQENKKLAEDMANSLSPEQKAALSKLMNDKSLLQKIFSNEKFREIMNKIGGDVNGHKGNIVITYT